MFRRILTALLTGAAFLALAWSLAAAADPPSDPFLRVDLRTDVEVDLAALRADLLPLALDFARRQDVPTAERIEAVLEAVGIDALSRLRLKEVLTKDGATASVTVTLDPGADGGLLAGLFAVPDGKCRFARYVPADQVQVFITLQNLPGNLAAFLDFLARPALRDLLPMLPVGPEGALEVAGKDLRRDLLPLLAGEVTLVQLPAAGNGPPPYIIALAAHDGFALRDSLLELAGGLLGGEASLMAGLIAGLPATAAGDFEVMELPVGAELAVGPDFLVVCTVPGVLTPLLEKPRGDLRVPDGRTWMRVDSEAWASYLGGQLGQMGAGGQEDASAAELRRILANCQPLGEEVRTSCKPGQLTIETRITGSTLTVAYQSLYAFLVEGLRAAEAKLQAERELEASRSELRALVEELDEALTLYGIDHGGLFPADPLELVATGYLETFPDLVPTPAAEYVDNGYTYLPLRDEDGRVAGYFLFLYGDDPAGANDVFTPENLADLEHFRPESDGDDDHVAAFCYDGLAIPLVKEWRGQR